jgi:hypothetical protein
MLGAILYLVFKPSVLSVLMVCLIWTYFGIYAFFVSKLKASLFVASAGASFPLLFLLVMVFGSHPILVWLGRVIPHLIFLLLLFGLFWFVAKDKALTKFAQEIRDVKEQKRGIWKIREREK